MKNNFKIYDVIVAGAGIAGSEAALFCAKSGLKTLIINISMDNPAFLRYSSKIGGKIKASLLKEINILGGFLQRAADRNKIAVKMEREGSVLSPACIVDKRNLSLFYKLYIENQDNLFTRQGLVTEIKKINKDQKRKYEIILNDGSIFYCKKIIIAAGTFLNGKTLWGKNIISAGRFGEIASESLGRSLKSIGYDFVKCRTFISPRIDKKTVKLKVVKKIKSDDFDNVCFDDSKNQEENIQKEKYFCYRSNVSKKIIKNTLSELKTEIIMDTAEIGKKSNSNILIEEAIENYKMENFINLFLFPEGTNTQELYAEGFFSILSEDFQQKLLNRFLGMENAVLTRPGYCIEYNCLKSGQLKSTLESIENEGMYFAGDINGPSEYEAASAQGVVAGINTSLNILKNTDLVFDKDKTLTGFIIKNINSFNINPLSDLIYLKAAGFKNYKFEETETMMTACRDKLKEVGL
ncbi:MAG: FAD-dependent oxidoreductase [Actinobacteria bacterium]|nr:FAD-dependent oxidoreductase [Actinomycetota bacterium]